MADKFPRLTPYIVVHNAKEAIEFYQKAFNAVAVDVMPDESGEKIMNAQLKFGDSMLMLNDEYPDWGVVSAKTLGANPVTIHISCEDVDAEFAQAVAAGCTVKMPLEDMFWGDRYGQVEDPYGYKWSLGAPIKK